MRALQSRVFEPRTHRGGAPEAGGMKPQPLAVRPHRRRRLTFCSLRSARLEVIFLYLPAIHAVLVIKRWTVLSTFLTSQTGGFARTSNPAWRGARQWAHRRRRSQQGDEFELLDIGAIIGSTCANADDPDHTNRVGARDAHTVV